MVRRELEKRLMRAGIDTAEPLLWLLRDTPTRIERKKPPPRTSQAPWASVKIRDIEMDLLDAISYASWLRSKISAHRLPDVAGSLNWYDVANVQHLARRLTLERLRAWRHEPFFTQAEAMAA
jgi:hypothetical protein